MNPNTTVSTASAPAIAFSRFIETTLITLLPMAILAALAALQQQLSSCTPGAITNNGSTVCTFHWQVIAYAFVASLVAGAINALTAFVTKTHQIATTPQAVVGEVIPTPGKGPDAVAGTTVPGTPIPGAGG